MNAILRLRIEELEKNCKVVRTNDADNIDEQFADNSIILDNNCCVVYLL